MSSSRTSSRPGASDRRPYRPIRRASSSAGAVALLAAVVVVQPGCDAEPTRVFSPEPAVELGAATPSASWRPLSSSDGSAATARHEAGAVVVGGRLYLMGGRGQRPLEVYDPATGRWRDLGPLPGELHHFQPVAIGSRIYIVGALQCCYPREAIERNVHVYDTVDGSWSIAGRVPEARARGGAGAFVRDGVIHLVGGNTLGHDGGSVAWFDAFDPASGEWRVLPDAPHARDHVGAALVGERVVVAGGRRSDLPDPFDNTVRATDVYDFASGSWSVGADIPTARAGAVTVVAGDEVVLAGGEVGTAGKGLDAVESYDAANDRWRSLPALLEGRHGGGGGVIGDTFHMVSGSLGRGGGPETSSHETLALAGGAGDADTDGDGLDDAAERDTWMTDPTRPDTDGDELGDGAEVDDHGTDPLSADSDADGLDDGEEVLRRNTDPLAADSDADGLDDGVEVTRHGTDPRAADTDADGTDDGEEIRLGRDPLVADGDGGSGTDGTTANGADDGDGSDETTTGGTVDGTGADGTTTDGTDDGDGTSDTTTGGTDEGGTTGGEVTGGASDGSADGTGAGTSGGEASGGGTDTGTSGGDAPGGSTGGAGAAADGGTDGDVASSGDDTGTATASGSSDGGGGGAFWLLAGALGAVRLTRGPRSGRAAVGKPSPAARTVAPEST